jgi:hypothetical protein
MKIRIVRHNTYYYAQTREWGIWKFIGTAKYDTQNEAEHRATQFINENKPVEVLNEYTVR